MQASSPADKCYSKLKKITVFFSPGLIWKSILFYYIDTLKVIPVDKGNNSKCSNTFYFLKKLPAVATLKGNVLSKYLI